MAVISSHTLNGVDGTHAGGILAVLTNLSTNQRLFAAESDKGGRLSQQVSADDVDPAATYELVLETGPYWAERNIPCGVSQIVLRFEMPDPDGSYHMPVILNPNAYSMWCSG